MVLGLSLAIIAGSLAFLGYRIRGDHSPSTRQSLLGGFAILCLGAALFTTAVMTPSAVRTGTAVVFLIASVVCTANEVWMWKAEKEER